MATFNEQDNIGTASDEWGLDAALFHPESTIYQLVEILLEGNDTIDENIQDVYEATHLDTASGGALNLIGELADLPRERGESDDVYRQRIRARLKSGSSNATFEDIVEYVATILDTDVENVSLDFDYANNPGGIQSVTAPLTAIQDSVLSVTQVTNLVEQTIPAGTNVDVNGDGTFEFASDTYTPPSGTGFGQGAFGQVFE